MIFLRILCIILSCALSIAIQSYAQSIERQKPKHDGFDPYFDETPMESPLHKTSVKYLKARSTLFKDTLVIDFEKRQITFKRIDKDVGSVLWQYHYNEFDTYFKDMQRSKLRNLWANHYSSLQYSETKQRSISSLDFELTSLQYPSWAKNFLGREPPKLSIKGFQSITFEFEQTTLKIGGVKQPNSGGTPTIDYDNMFTINGSVGRLLNLEIRIGKEKTTSAGDLQDQMKKLKVEYKAEPDSVDQLEDQIIQEVVVGYTNFQMPGQGLAGYSGTHEGLFGIKVRSQWGPLSLTNIISRENADTKKQTLTISGTQSSGEIRIRESDYVKNTYFFLDSVYLNNWLKNFNLPPADKVKGPKIGEVKLYKLDRNEKIEDNALDYVYAYFAGQKEPLRFKILYWKKDFDINPEEGYIQFLETSRPLDNEVIGLYLRTDDPSKNKGDTTKVKDPNGIYKDALKNLWILKNEYQLSDNSKDSTYFLMWRNVYPLPQDAKPEGLTLKIVRKTQGKDEEKNSEGKLFGSILGITDDNGAFKASDGRIYDDNTKQIIMPPFSYGGTMSNLPFINPALGKMADGSDNLNYSIYYDSLEKKEDMYNFITFGSTRKTQFMLDGGGVIQNTDKLRDGKGDLQRGTDYDIDYDIGMIELRSDRAKNAGSIEVNYQSQRMFIAESKTFLGAFGKLNFPLIGKESYFATTLMGEFSNASNKLPEIGSEPFDRFLYDSYLKFDFEPEWMTAAINRVPFLSTSSVSTAAFDAEIAYSRQMPNQRHKGQASIDNFEQSRDLNELYSSTGNWHLASPSKEWYIDDVQFLMRPPAWKTYWYSPKYSDQVRKEEIVKVKVENASDAYLSTMRLVVQPLPQYPVLLENVKKNGIIGVKPWGGIMYPLPAMNKNQYKKKYFEFWVKNKPKSGVLFIDFGVVSEALCISGGKPDLDRLKYEKKSLTSEYDSTSDMGLDGLRDPKEFYLFPNVQNNTFDTIRYQDSRLPKTDEFFLDPGHDNYASYETEKELLNRSKASGTDRSAKNETEDINDNGFMTDESYFRVKIDFSNPALSNCLDTAKTKSANMPDAGWLYFKIPLNVPNDTTHFYQIVNNPEWKNIQFVRMLWTDFKSEAELTKENALEFYDLKFSGSKWTIALSDTARDRLIATQLNTTDDNKIYWRPPQKDSIDIENVQQGVLVDYALNLTYKNMRRGQKSFVRQDLSSNPKDLSLYDQIHMYLNENRAHLFTNSNVDLLALDPNSGELVNGSVIPADFIRFVFRFGNTDSSYYEYQLKFFASYKGQAVYNKRCQQQYWVSKEGLSIKLNEFLKLKEKYYEKMGVRPPSINVSDTLNNGDIITIYSKTGAFPTLSKVSYFAFGVTRDEGASGVCSGEIWVNSLRVSGINSFGGWAFRTNLTTHWADFMDISGNISYDNTNFRQMGEDPHLRKDSRMSSGINCQWSLSKFLPEQLGINIPLGVGVSASLLRPQLRPGTDIKLLNSRGTSDGVSNMTEDFVDLVLNSRLSKNKTPAEHFQKNSLTRTWYTGYSKSARSDNPLVAFTADRVITDYSYAKDSTTEYEGAIPASEKQFVKRPGLLDDHINVITSRTHTSKLGYDLSPRNPPAWTSWTPFSQVTAKFIPQSIKAYQLNLLPSRFNFDVANGSYVKKYSYRSLEEKDSVRSVEKTVEYLNMAHAFQFAYTPISPVLEFNYDLGVSRIFDEVLATWHQSGVGKFVRNHIVRLDPVWNRYLILSMEKSRKQNASVRFDPIIFEWLSHTFQYNSRYEQQPRDYGLSKGYITTKPGNEFSVTSNLRFLSLFSGFDSQNGKPTIMQKLMASCAKNLEAISLNDISFTYKAIMDLSNNYFDYGFFSRYLPNYSDYFLYQLGLKNRNFRDIITGTMNDKNAFGGMFYRSSRGGDYNFYKNDMRTTSQEYTVGTTFRIPNPLDITMSPVSIAWKRDYRVTPDINYMDTTIEFPKISVGASSTVLERISFVKKFMQTANVKSIYSYTRKKQKQYQNPLLKTIKINAQYVHDLNPLFGFDGMVKRLPVNVNYTVSYNRDKSETINSNPITGDTVDDKSGMIKTTFGNSLKLAYTIGGRSDREVSILNRWKMIMKGDLALAMNVDYSRSYSRRAVDSRSFSDWKFVLHPNATYNFTDNIDGLLEYTYSQDYIALSDQRRSSNKFALTMTIHFK